MKKIFVSFALATVTLFSSSVYARQNVSDDVNKQEERKELKKERKNPFEGINLDDKQKESLQTLEQNFREKQKELREVKKADKEKRDKGNFEEMQKSRKDYLAGIKEILTPEQYCQFLENCYINNFNNGPSQSDRGHGRMAKKAPRDKNKNGEMKKENKKGQRPEKKD